MTDATHSGAPMPTDTDEIDAAAVPAALLAEPVAPPKRRRSRDIVLIASATYVLLLIGWSALSLPLPHDPVRGDLGAVMQSPSGEHWFGTDQNGYDIFSRIVYAAKNDAVLAASGVLIATVLGTMIGIAFSRPGIVSAIGMRLLDLFQSVPLLVIAITLIGLTNGSTFVLTIVIIMVNLPLFIRLVRAEALIVRRTGFVSVAKTYGVGEFRIAWRHLVPNCSGVILPQVSLSLAGAIITISALGFLGLQRPGTASWGTILNSGVALSLTGQWWISFFPAVIIFVTVLAFSELSFRLQRLIENPMNRGD